MDKSQKETSQCIASNDDSSFPHEESPADIVHVHSVSQSVPESFKIPVEVNGTPITRAADSLVSEATWSEQLHRPKLEPCTLKLQSYPD